MSETGCADCAATKWVALIGALIITFASLGSATAAGDPDAMLDRLSPEDEARVIELLDEGETAYADGDYRQALRIYHRLYAFFPHPDVNYRVATCYEHLGEPERAIQHFIHFLEGYPDAEERPEVEARIERLREEIGPDPTGVRVETFPIGSQIYVDDRDTAPVGETPNTVNLPPGTYDIYVDQAGYAQKSKSVTVREGSVDVIQFRLESDGSGDRAGSRRGGTRSQPDSGTDHRWMPIMAATMAGMGGFALHQSAGYRSEYRDLEEGHPDRDGKRSSAIQFGVFGGTMLTGAVVFTTWFILRNRSPDIGERADRGVGITPTDDGLSIGVFSRF